MPVPHSHPGNNTRSQRNKAVLPPTERPPFDHIPSIHQLSANLDRGLPMEGAVPSRRGGVKARKSSSISDLLGGYPGSSKGLRRILGKAEDEEAKESVEEEEYEETEVEAPL
ncbi:hypothetical protein O181_034651 [Austropuccinia psidii MF-1]|uniref:Uncharacterized protein n=1 Tax=Austropuccinia psidii MF-1 TaxID=1389203 RepID=A0A9Q3H887_9BASI|nr:hypothetical protein [Austropuccinia psidii MF-1]